MNRPPVTVTSFLELLKDANPFAKVLMIVFFQMPEDVAISELDRIAEGIEVDNPDDVPGKQGAIESMHHMKAALSKMTDGEKSFLRKKLADPRTILNFMTPDEIAQGTIEIMGAKNAAEHFIPILAQQHPDLFLELVEEARRKQEQQKDEE